MSKLAEKIRASLRVQPQQLGFGAAKSAVMPTLVLAGLARDAKGAADLAQRGADVVILGSADKPAASDGVGLNGAIAGAWISGVATDEAKRYREAGFDFVIFDPNRTAAAALLDDRAGYVMALPSDLSDIQLRTLESFQLDALYVGAIAASLTVRQQIDLQRVQAVTRKPLMAMVPPGISVADLHALRETGVIVVTTDSAANVEQLRRTIDALPPRVHRRDDRDRPMAMVPSAASRESQEGEEDDE